MRSLRSHNKLWDDLPESKTVNDVVFAVSRRKGLITLNAEEVGIKLDYTEFLYKQDPEFIWKHISEMVDQYEEDKKQATLSSLTNNTVGRSSQVSSFEGHDEIYKEIKDQENMPHVALVGRRMWGINFLTKRLVSLNENVEWPAREDMVAVCTAERNHSEDDTVPVKGCTCGLYASRADVRLGEFVQITETSNPRNPSIAGEVYLWGKVQHGLKGFKAERGYPKQLFTVPDADGNAPWFAEAIAEEYGVPLIVKTIDELNDY